MGLLGAWVVGAINRWPLGVSSYFSVGLSSLITVDAGLFSKSVVFNSGSVVPFKGYKRYPIKLGLKTVKTHFYLAGMLLFIVAYSPAWSQNILECDYSGTQSQMNVCAKQEFQASDLELNRVYKQLKSSLTPAEYKVLLKEQRAWLKERDPKCEKEANDEAEGGSMWPLIFDSCRTTSTNARIEQLRQWKK